MVHFTFLIVTVLFTTVFLRGTIQSVVSADQLQADQSEDIAIPLAQTNPSLTDPVLPGSNSSSEVVLPLSIPLSTNASSQVSNFAEYNEPCTNFNTGKMCNHLKDLICDNMKCICNTNVADPDTPVIYTAHSDRCLKIATAKNLWACSDDLQCSNAKYGKYSRCNRYVGTGTGKCECFDTELQGRDVLFVGNVCYVRKEIDHKCLNDMECNATIVGDAVCLGSDGFGKPGVCKCADQHQFEPNFRECLKLGTQHSQCKSDFQCQHQDALGPLSICNKTRNVCDCWDTIGNGDKNTKFHKGRCNYSRRHHETCDEKIECILGYNKNADCLPHPSYNNEKVCQCSPGATCRNSGATPIPSTIIVAIFSLLTYIYIL